jgi:hypothetical protein
MIAKLHAEGLNNTEIARRLKEAGYRSERTNKPINGYAVGYHVRRLDADKTPKVVLAAPKGAEGTQNSKLRLALEVLQSDLPEATRAEVAVRILNS